MSLFVLKCQVGGVGYEATAEHRGRAIAVLTDGGAFPVRSLRQAIDAAASALGPHLARADHNGLPWGLYVSTGGRSVAYGAWPRSPAPDIARPRDRQLERILALWRPEDGAVGALENAAKVIQEFAERRAVAA